MPWKASVKGWMTWPTDALARRERYLTRFAANMAYLVLYGRKLHVYRVIYEY
jgi:hypothetical protein